MGQEKTTANSTYPLFELDDYTVVARINHGAAVSQKG